MALFYGEQEECWYGAGYQTVYCLYIRISRYHRFSVCNCFMSVCVTDFSAFQEFFKSQDYNIIVCITYARMILLTEQNSLSVGQLVA